VKPDGFTILSEFDDDDSALEVLASVDEGFFLVSIDCLASTLVTLLDPLVASAISVFAFSGDKSLIEFTESEGENGEVRGILRKDKKYKKFYKLFEK